MKNRKMPFCQTMISMRKITKYKIILRTRYAIYKNRNDRILSIDKLDSNNNDKQEKILKKMS